MDVDKLINFIRTNQDVDLSKRVLSEILEKFWNRGFEKRNQLELRLYAARHRMKKRKENELEHLFEIVSRQGYYDNNLRKEVMKRYMDDIPINENDV